MPSKRLTWSHGHVGGAGYAAEAQVERGELDIVVRPLRIEEGRRRVERHVRAHRAMLIIPMRSRAIGEAEAIGVDAAVFPAG